jgi:hypothetical protein
MKYFIKIQESHWVSGSNNKMIHKDKQGKLFLGPPLDVALGETIIVEASDTPLEDGYYHIIKVIGRMQK